jgi:hypothetical protein
MSLDSASYSHCAIMCIRFTYDRSGWLVSAMATVAAKLTEALVICFTRKRSTAARIPSSFRRFNSRSHYPRIAQCSSKNLSTHRHEPSNCATCSRQKACWIPPSPGATPVCWRRSVDISVKASVEERFVYALCQAGDDPDDQESLVVYGKATRLSLAAPASLPDTSGLSYRSRIGQELER